MFSSPTIRLHMDIHKKDINILTNYTMMCDYYGIIKSHLKTTWHYVEHLPRRRWHFTFNNEQGRPSVCESNPTQANFQIFKWKFIYRVFTTAKYYLLQREYLVKRNVCLVPFHKRSSLSYKILKLVSPLENKPCLSRNFYFLRCIFLRYINYSILLWEQSISVYSVHILIKTQRTN